MPPHAYDPFANYAPRLYCPDISSLVKEGHCTRDVLKVQALFSPEVRLHTSSTAVLPLVAHANGSQYPLGTIQDLLSWKGDANEFVHHFHGRVGERLFSLVLERFVSQLAQEAQDAGQSETGGKVLREKRKYRQGRGDIIYFNNEYVLKFDRRTTFTLLQKVRAGSHEFRYKQEQIGLDLTEIDGLGYLHVNGRKYLLIGDIKQRTNPSSDPWDLDETNPRGTGNLERRLFTPLKTLYPDHHFVYVVMAAPDILFNPSTSILGSESTKFAGHLTASGVTPVFIPSPVGVDCLAVAQQFHTYLVLVRGLRQMFTEMMGGG